MELTPELTHRLARVRLLLMDVDGVLTDGTVLNIPGPNGEWVETKAFDTQDGLSMMWLAKHGIQTGVISGRVSPAVEIRAKQVRVSYIYQGHLEKIPILEEILGKSGLTTDQVAYMGDDFIDIAIMRRVGFSFAPANARDEVKQVAALTTRASGGAGAVREAVEAILKAQGHWGAILKQYEAAP